MAEDAPVNVLSREVTSLSLLTRDGGSKPGRTHTLERASSGPSLWHVRPLLLMDLVERERAHLNSIKKMPRLVQEGWEGIGAASHEGKAEKTYLMMLTGGDMQCMRSAEVRSVSSSAESSWVWVQCSAVQRVSENR